jgi:hypothetical protein
MSDLLHLQSRMALSESEKNNIASHSQGRRDLGNGDTVEVWGSDCFPSKARLYLPRCDDLL